MSADRAVKKVFMGRRGGRRKTARPKSRLSHCIENDLKSMSAKTDGGRKRKTDVYRLSS
jgi:hypothetical protein